MDLVYGGLLHDSEISDYATYSSQRVTVRWLDEWSVREASEIPGTENPATDVQPDPDIGFTPDVRAALIETGGPGWMEYSNAPE